jgi:hypothetical protein
LSSLRQTKAPGLLAKDLLPKKVDVFFLKKNNNEIEINNAHLPVFFFQIESNINPFRQQIEHGYAAEEISH